MQSYITFHPEILRCWREINGKNRVFVPLRILSGQTFRRSPFVCVSSVRHCCVSGPLHELSSISHVCRNAIIVGIASTMCECHHPYPTPLDPMGCVASTMCASLFACICMHACILRLLFFGCCICDWHHITMSLISWYTFWKNDKAS